MGTMGGGVPGPKRGAGGGADRRALPAWIAGYLPTPAEIRDALRGALDRDAVAQWWERPWLVGAAEIVARWHASGAATVVGGAAGRLLAASWLRRVGFCRSLALMPSVGFMGHAASY